MPKTNKILNSFNAGELSPLMDARTDQEKYVFGCRTMENFIPLIYGGAERRPGLEYIAGCKSNSAKSRLVAFEHSVDDTYMLEFANQVIRVFRSGARVLDSSGTESLGSLDNIIAHWLCNETNGTDVVDADGGTHNGTATVDCGTLTKTGKVGSGCFDLNGQYCIEVSDHNDFSFTDDSDDTAFSIALWAYVEDYTGYQTLVSKWRNASTVSEWCLDMTNEKKLRLRLADTSGALTSNVVCQWKLNDNAANTNVIASLPQYSIDDADAGNNKFIISGDGDLSASFPNASEFTVEGSTGNDGQYTVVSTSYSSPDFTINVASVTDDTNDGTIAPHAGVASANTSTLTATGKISNAFDLGGTAAVEVDDSADFSFGNGTADSAFSISAWVYVTDTSATQAIISKHDSSKREWLFFISSEEHLGLIIYDESAAAWAMKLSDGQLSIGWHYVVATYDGTGGSTCMTGGNLYVDGVLVDSTAYYDGTYVAMENLTSKVAIGAYYVGASLSNYFADKIDNVIIFDSELNSASVMGLYNSGSGTESLVTKSVQAVSDSALTTGWHFLAATYSAPSDSSTAASGIILYVDGSAVDSTATNDSGYTAMQNGAEEVRIGANRNSGDSANENFWQERIDEVSIFGDVLTATEVSGLYSTTTYEITAPYLTADLFELKFEPSADVMFITHPDYEPRKLSRKNHNNWTLEVLNIQTGPFRSQNITTSATITPSATTGNITLTASGCTPFVSGTTEGHLPSGGTATSKSQTGALFKIIQAAGTTSVTADLDLTSANDASSTLTIPNGIIWDYVTNGTWTGTVVLERSYDSGTTYETVNSTTSADNNNTETSGEEIVEDAIYRARVSTTGTGTCNIELSVRDTSHIGIVEITSVLSPTSATAKVLKTLGSTDLTHRWAEGSFSNYRGWPIDVAISAEERLTFAGNKSQPLNIWASAVGDFTDFAEGSDDDSPLSLSLIGTGQQNRVRWILAKEALIIGTVGGEHLLGASKEEEALTPTNIKAKIQTTKGSEDIAAITVGQAVLFVQRGGKKIREFLYDYESDSHKADDLTVFANHILGLTSSDGVVDMDYQRTPEPLLWCVRNDGQIAVMSYERDQKVFAWSRIVTSDSTSDSEFESVAVMYGGTRAEDEVWATVKRTINGSTVRYIERFKPRNWGSDDEDAFFVDSGVTYDSTATTSMTGATHLVGETVAIYADGAKQTSKTVASDGTFTLETAASKVQYGLAYTSTLKPMKLDISNTGRAPTKKITRGIISLYKTMRGEWGCDTSQMDPIVYRRAGVTTTEFPMYTGDIEMPFRAGYEKSGDVIVRQTDPLPMTVLALTLDVGVHND